MNIDNFLPLIIMLAYIGALLLKTRKKKKTTAGPPPKKMKQKTRQKNAVPGRPAPFKKLTNFFRELRRQLQEEIDKARLQAEKPRRGDPSSQNRKKSDFSFSWEEYPINQVPTPVSLETDLPEPLPCSKTQQDDDTLRKKAEHSPAPIRQPAPGSWTEPRRTGRSSLQKAVIWSEILAPPKALRKRENHP